MLKSCHYCACLSSSTRLCFLVQSATSTSTLKIRSCHSRNFSINNAFPPHPNPPSPSSTLDTLLSRHHLRRKILRVLWTALASITIPYTAFSAVLSQVRCLRSRITASSEETAGQERWLIMSKGDQDYQESLDEERRSRAHLATVSKHV